MSIFFNSDSELRSGWKLAVYSVVFVLIAIGTAISISMVLDLTTVPESEIMLLALNAGALIVPAVLAALFMARFVDRLPLGALGIGLHEGWLRDVFIGLGVAVAMLLALLAGSAILGHLEMRWIASSVSIPALSLTIGVLLIAAANEELVFRGYPMQVLMKGIGIWPAMLVMSALFGALHASNPHASLMGVGNTVLAGILLSLAYLKTRSLWLPYSIHVGWNVGLVVLGFPVSGINLPSLWSTSVEGAPAALGGDYGPEGGYWGTMIFGAAALAVWSIRAARVSPQIRAALAAHPHKVVAAD